MDLEALCPSVETNNSSDGELMIALGERSRGIPPELRCSLWKSDLMLAEKLDKIP